MRIAPHRVPADSRSSGAGSYLFGAFQVTTGTGDLQDDPPATLAALNATVGLSGGAHRQDLDVASPQGARREQPVHGSGRCGQFRGGSV